MLCFCWAAWASAAVCAADEPKPYVPPESVYTEPVVEPELASCPEEPEDLSAEAEEYSDQLIELRSGRIDAIRICRALAQREDLVARRLWWAVVEAAEGRGQRTVANERLATLLAEGCEGPCPVTVAAAEGETAELVSSIDAGAEATRIALYLIAGLGVGAVLFVGIREVVNRAH